ncbi:hypothetical protein [Streptomyces daliensis]|uniref:Uncharacterized protein n=1 Tax=Streptomyces daliensis TaxID=299421 RepID=A0A8T4J036_9ACTN|nr:hypothetical protein [Streptomyces daliensis]
MTAHDREQKQGMPSMRELLASCAAADAVSQPPSAPADAPARTDRPAPVSVPAATQPVPDQRPGRDAA